MRIAVITPYYKESEDVIRQCHESVLAQTTACDHFLIADGFPQEAVASWQVNHFALPHAHADGGNVGRLVGSISAFNQGYDAVAFLDADNWYKPDHIRKMVELQRSTGAAVCTVNRSMHRIDGSFMYEDEQSDGRSHVDTNCFFLTRAALPVIASWAHIPKEFNPVVDTIYWCSFRRARLPHAHLPASTVCYRTPYEADYHRIGEEISGRGKKAGPIDQAFEWFKALPAAERWQIWRDFGFPSRRLAVAKLHVHYATSRFAPPRSRATP